MATPTSTQGHAKTSSDQAPHPARRGLPGRVPSPPAGRRRSYGLFTAGALLAVGCALLAALLVARAGDKHPVVMVAQPVAKGHVVDRSDVTTSQVAGVTDGVPATDLDEVVGSTAATDLLPGQVVTHAMVTTALVPATGQAVVGLSLEPGQVPADGLAPGDVVRLIVVAGKDSGGSAKTQDKPAVLADRATVYATRATTTGRSVTVIVADTDADRVASYGSAGQLAVVKIAAGS